MLLFCFIYSGARAHNLAESYAISRALAAISVKSDKIDQVEQVVQKFLSYLAAHPEDAKGWYLLGRLYLDQGNVVKAADAFKHSLKNDPKNGEIMAQYAQTLYFLHHQELTDEALKSCSSCVESRSQKCGRFKFTCNGCIFASSICPCNDVLAAIAQSICQNTPEFKMITTAIEICKKRGN